MKSASFVLDGIKVKKILIAFVIATLLLQAFLIASAMAASHHKIERRIFVHYANSNPEKAPAGGIGFYALMGVQWDALDLPVKVEVNPSGSGLSDVSVISAISMAAEEWDDGDYSRWGGVAGNFFAVATAAVTTTFDVSLTDYSMDSKNTIVWG